MKNTLSYFSLDKMDAILQTIFQMHFYEWKVCFSIKIPLHLFVPRGPIDNYAVLFLIMAWRRIGDKPLSEPTLTWFAGAYMRH